MTLTRAKAAFKPRLIVPTQNGIAHPLPAGHSEPARMPMHLVYPRPDVETQAHARHRVYHSQMLYEIPIGVQGGAWPFKYEITSGPAGATIGQTLGAADYGILKWDSGAETANQSFTVLITDQELNTIEATWSTINDDSAFVFIKQATPVSGVGSRNDPLKTFPDWYKDSSADATYLNKVAVFHGGNYTLRGNAGSTDNISLLNGSKTPSIIRYPGETPIFDCSTVKILTDSLGGGMKDIFMQGIRFEHARHLDVANAHFIWVRGVPDRCTFDDCYFYDMPSGGTEGTDNTCPIFISSAGVGNDKYNILIKRVTYEAINNPVANGSYTDIYHSYYTLFEECRALNCSSSYGLWCKGTTAFTTVRNCKLFENVTGRQISIGYGQAETYSIAHDHEVCWNKIKEVSASATTDIYLWAMKNQNVADTYNSFEYRNSFYTTGRVNHRFVTQGLNEIRSNNNVVICANAVGQNGHWDETMIITDVGQDNIHDTIAGNTTTDTNGDLPQGSPHIGLKGWQVQ